MIKLDFMTIISIICTIASGIGAIKSNIYYKKSKQISIYANTNSAYIETKKIIDTLTEILKLVSEPMKRGKNYRNEVKANGEIIKKSISKIREDLTVEDNKEVNKLLNSKKLKVEIYIDSFITGSVLVDKESIIDDDFYKCQEIFRDLQLLIKGKLENVGENLK